MRRGSTIFRMIACGCVGLILILGILAAWPEAHHWLHHDCDDADHECAVVVFAHGLTLLGDGEAPVAIFLFVVAVLIAAYGRPDFREPSYALLPERGPPA
jgi:hypothetical protein